VLKHEAYPNITYWFCHEYFSALAEDKITSVDDAPVKAQGAEHNEVDDDEDDANGEDDNGLVEQTSGAPKGKRGKGRASQGQNVKMRYIQHENGEVIDGWRASDIRRYARSIFVGFALEGKVFHSWVEGVDAASRTSYYRDMWVRFPEVGLCELDWKAEQVASDIYSQWRSSWINKQEAEKTKGTSLPNRLVDESSKDLSRKKMKPSKSRSESMTLDPSPADFSDAVCLSIHIILDPFLIAILRFHKSMSLPIRLPGQHRLRSVILCIHMLSSNGEFEGTGCCWKPIPCSCGRCRLPAP
jgi:hypothetical protein